MSHPRSASPTELLGYLNEVEQRNAPKHLFHHGDLKLLQEPRVAIVGTRQATPEGLRRTARLARELVANGVVVVSGLASGIDTAAHRAAIEAGGRTIAVLGNPLSVSFPRENRDLQETICRAHLCLSQFPEGRPTRKTDFPLRNRTMALLSHATVIVESQERSGTVSQAWEAIRLGRRVFLLRSLVEGSGLVWPRLLLDYGAEILDTVDQILAELPPRWDAQFVEVAF